MPRRNKPIRHTPYSSDRPCERKQRFKTEAEALKMVEQAELIDMKLSLYTYKCPYCGGWHLSSQNTGQ
ncbi:MAG TPA: hypothetical protein PK096_02410 [Candidatus Saccharibacteria bacterium]|nr:hypothetical protein [Candidatus Saccharibacteria bacterium]HRK94197.1 hypothetical protein [Candidatus Saccharibacteria bacterium]